VAIALIVHGLALASAHHRASERERERERERASTVLHLRPEAPRKSAICHTSPSQTPYTCITAPQSALLHIMLIAPREGVLRTLPHRSQPVQRPCSSRNRKPIRPGAARWASWRGSGDNAVERT